MTSLFAKFAPHIHELTEKIVSSIGTNDYEKMYAENYEQMPEINFDNAVLESLEKSQALVTVSDIGWSDVGAWEALKEALEDKKEDNITKGEVMLQDTTDTLAYNYDDKKLVVGIDLY